VLEDGRHEEGGKIAVVFKPTLEEITGPYAKAVPVWTNWVRRRLEYEKGKGCAYWLR
jgi:hypothetical protein